MNMITVLLGATGLLLVVAVALSIGAMNKGTDADEIAKLKQEITALKAGEEQFALRPSGSALDSSSGPLTPVLAPDPVTLAPGPVSPAGGGPVANPGLTPPAPVSAETDVPELGEEDEIAKLEAELKSLEQENEILSTSNEETSNENKILKTEIGIAWQPLIAAEAKNAARVDTIRRATPQARVTQWSDEGGFAVIEILERDNVQTGTVLAIRRQTGIYGQVKVGQMYEAGQAAADPLPATFLGKDGVDIQPGDELIVPPL